MRQNGNGTVTLEDARVWLEETGFCLFLPRKQSPVSLAPSFVEAVAGQRNPTPDQKQIAQAEELLVRMELDGVAVRLNLSGQLGEQPDYIVAGWVLPYVYALRGDRDWRRIPQLTGSRQVSPLAVQTYKLLEPEEMTVTKLAHALGREVTESAVIRAITELWQQLRIIPVISAPGQPAKWQLLRVRFQKAIAEGASTSQVTAISVLASIYLQAVIAATMEEVEVFLAPLTARSKVREVLRGLVATRQVHTLSLGHAPHYYVAGTLPEFNEPVSLYSSSIQPSYFFDHEEDHPPAPVIQQPVRQDRVFPAAPITASKPALTPTAAPAPKAESAPAAAPVAAPAPAAPAAPVAPAAAVVRKPSESHAPRTAAPRKPVSSSKSSARPHFSRSSATSRDRKPSAGGSASRPAHRTASSSPAKPASSRSRTTAAGSKSSAHKSEKPASWSRTTGSKPKSAAPARKEVRSSSRKPVLAGAKSGARKGITVGARSKQGAKKR